MTQHFGTHVNTTDFVEQDAVVVYVAASAGQPASTALRVSPRPAPGTVLQVRRTDTQVTFDPITVDGSGYWDLAIDDDTCTFVDVSTDGTLWITCQSRESRLAVGSLASTGASTVDGITDAGSAGRAVMRSDDAETARDAIGAGTSNLALGSTAGTAKSGDWKPATTDISDASTTGRAVIKATDASAARAALSLDKVNNTADADKPVSNATATALAGKQPTIPQFANQAAADAARAAGQLTPGQLLLVLAT